MRALLAGLLLLSAPAFAASDDPQRIGNVSTTFRVVGRNDPSRFSIACRATGPVTLADKLPENEVVFGASANWLFKEIRVTRMWDAEKQTLVYLVWSTQALSTGGSPYNSVSVVPVRAAP